MFVLLKKSLVEISQVIKNKKEISLLDPFEIDQELACLPEINTNKDIEKLLRILSLITDKFELIKQANFNTSQAMLRDIGFIISSLRRFNIQICEADKIIESALILLGEKTNSIPRETSYHYGICNPTDSRQRTFTNYPDEVHLINGVRIFAVDLEIILNELIRTYSIIEKDESISEDLIQYITEKLNASFQAVGSELRKIDPYIFSTELRPYFDPINVAGQLYVGPGGGQVPLLIIDNILFAFGLPKDHVYRVFSEEGISFLTEELREIYKTYSLKIPLVDLCVEKQHKTSIKLLEELFNSLIKYRQAHYTVAKNALSEKNKGNYNTGSAGYRLDMVYQTLMATKEAKRKISLIDN